MQMPFLLADIESFIAGTFMVIAFISWISNLAGKNKPVPKAGNRRPMEPRPQPDPKSIQSEIDRFLDQTRQSTSPPPKKETSYGSEGVEVIPRPENQQPRRAPASTQRRRSQREIWEEQTRKESTPRPPKPVTKSPSKPQAQQNQPPRPRPSQPLSTRPVQQLPSAAPKTPRAAEVKQNRQAAPSRVTTSVANDIAANVSAHLGTFGAKAATALGEQAIAATTTNAATPASRIAQRIRSKHGMRDAILINEILTKPRALRR